MFERTVRQVIQVEVDEVQSDAIFTAACVPVIGEAAEVADAFLGVAVDGDVLMMALATSIRPGMAGLWSMLLSRRFCALTLMTTTSRTLPLVIWR